MTYVLAIEKYISDSFSSNIHKMQFTVEKNTIGRFIVQNVVQ